MKDFLINRKNKKIEIVLYFLIFLLFLIPLLLINNLIFFEGYEVETNNTLEVSRLKTLDSCYKGLEENLIALNNATSVNTSYRDVYIFPDIENFKCIGKIVDLYIDEDKSEVIIGFNKKVFLYYYNSLIIFFTLVFFFLKPNYKKIYLYFFCFLLGYSVLYKYSYLNFNSIGSHPFEIKNDFLFLLIIFFFKNYKNNQIKSTVFIFYLFFHPSLFGILILFIFFVNKYSLSNFFMNKKLFYSLPIIFASIRFLGGLSDKTVVLWASLIQDPLTGFSIFPDLQISLTAMNCSDPSFLGNTFLYTGYFLECPVPFYNPLFQFFNIDINLNFLIFFISFLFFIIYSGIYRFFLNYFKNNNEVVVFFMLSPCLNFLFNYGNLDIFTLSIGLVALYKFQERWFLGTVLIFFLAINEIHPLGLILGIIVTSFFKRNFKIFFVNILSLLSFFLVLNQDNSEFSVKNELLNFSQTTDSLDYVGNLGVAYGITLDLQKLLNIFNLEYSLSVGFIALISLSGLVLIFGPRLFKDKVNYDYIENSLLIWFIFSALLSNNSHRLANFIFIIFLIYLSNSKVLKMAVIISLFLNPNTQIYGSEFANFQIVVNRIGIYTLLTFGINHIFQFIKNRS